MAAVGIEYGTLAIEVGFVFIFAVVFSPTFISFSAQNRQIIWRLECHEARRTEQVLLTYNPPILMSTDASSSLSNGAPSKKEFCEK